MSFKTKFLIVLFAIVIAGIIFVSIQENQKPREKAELNLSLQPGEQHEVKLTSFRETIQTYKDQVHKLGENAEAVIGFDVAGIDANGAINIDLCYKSIKIKYNTLKEEFEFDLKNIKHAEPNDYVQNGINITYQAIIGSKISTKIGPMGRQICDFKGIDGINTKIEKLIDKTYPPVVFDMNSFKEKNEDSAKKFLETMAMAKIPAIVKSVCNEILSSAMSETKETVNYIFIKYPDRLVMTGNKWYDKSQLNMGMVADANVTYIFKRKENGIAYIDSIYDVDMGKNFKITEITSGETIRKCISGALTVSTAVDANTGLFQRSEAVVKFSGVQQIETNKLILPIRPNMTIPIKIEGSIVIELIK